MFIHRNLNYEIIQMAHYVKIRLGDESESGESACTIAFRPSSEKLETRTNSLMRLYGWEELFGDESKWKQKSFTGENFSHHLSYARCSDDFFFLFGQSQEGTALSVRNCTRAFDDATFGFVFPNRIKAKKGQSWRLFTSQQSIVHCGTFSRTLVTFCDTF